MVVLAVANERAALNISAYKASAMEQGLLSYPEFLVSHLEGDGADPSVLLEHGRKMGVLLKRWLTSVHEPGRFYINVRFYKLL